MLSDIFLYMSQGLSSMQISQKDLQILDTLGRGASSVVCKIVTSGPACLMTEDSDTQTDCAVK